ncbi:MAG: hypothetical protein U5J95_02080 [Balneolaceae bacterium]|nr:hypothetical protein [Balneolaceae bacterium]
MSYSMTNNSDYPLEIDFTEPGGKTKKITVPPKRSGNNVRSFDPDESKLITYTSRGKEEVYIRFKASHQKGPEEHIDGEAGHPDK